MKINKIFIPLVAVASMFGYACTDEVEYTPAEPAAVTEFYFPTVQNYNNDLVDGDTAVIVSISRAKSVGSATVDISSTVTPDNPFTIPSSITFPDGVGTVDFKVEFELADLMVNQEYKVTLQIPGIEDTPYSLGKLELTLLYLPWVDFEEDNSMGLYTDASVAPLYGRSAEQYSVKIQKHPTTPGIYRIVNPYGENWPYNGGFKYDNTTDHYMVVNAQNPEHVYIEEFDTGLRDSQDGPIYLQSYSFYAKGQLPAADWEEWVTSKKYWATLNNGIVKFDESNSSVRQAMLVTFPEAPNPDDIGPYIGNNGNLFKIVLPGYEDEPEWEDYGMCDFTDGLLGPWFGILNNKYSVLVEHSLKDNDLYRIVNPYGPNSGYFDEEPESKEYIQFSVADPDFVTIGEFQLGLYIDANRTKALYYLTSMADIAINYMNQSPAEAKAAGYGAVYKDKVLTLAADNCAGLILDVATSRLSIGFPDESCDMILDMSNPIPVETEEAEVAQAKSKKARVSKLTDICDSKTYRKINISFK